MNPGCRTYRSSFVYTYMTNLFGKGADIRGEQSPALPEFSTVQQAIFMEDIAIFFSLLSQLPV